MEIAAYYKLDNLVGILDVNRLGQRGETMYGHDLDVYDERVSRLRLGDHRHRRASSCRRS